jgi:hypothetical protein
MAFLLDINVLVALFDSSHVNHDAAHDWFGRAGSPSWATCPIAENGFIVVQATPNDIMERLARFCALPGHAFWPDDISHTTALDADAHARLQGCHQLTDFYLAALAAHKGGKLATFDGSFARSLNGAPLAHALQLLR